MRFLSQRDTCGAFELLPSELVEGSTCYTPALKSLVISSCREAKVGKPGILQFIQDSVRRILFSILIILPTLGTAQDIVGVNSTWSDSFREWIFLTPDDDRSGKLYMRWPARDDWAQWDFRLRDTTASLSLKWKDNPNLWEVRCLGTTVTARTMWSGDFSQWRISDGTHSIVWKSKYGNRRDEWIVRDDVQGFFSVYTYWEGDPREWVVYDDLNEEVSYAMRLTMIFLALHHSTPRI